MKRLTFLRNISLVGAVAAIAPIGLVARETSSRIPIPNWNKHGPHANFAASIDKWIRVAELKVEILVESFSRNGLEDHSDDLTVFHLKRNDQLMLVSSCGNFWNVVGHIDGLNFCEKEVPGISSNQHTLTLNPHTSCLSLSRII